MELKKKNNQRTVIEKPLHISRFYANITQEMKELTKSVRRHYPTGIWA
jgi:hypothetical protein